MHTLACYLCIRYILLTLDTILLQVKHLVQKDCRIRLMNEVLNGIKVIKLYVWEDHFQKELQSIRNKELAILKQATYFNVLETISWTCAPFMVIVLYLL